MNRVPAEAWSFTAMMVQTFITEIRFATILSRPWPPQKPLPSTGQSLLSDFYAYRKSAIEEGRKGKIKSYIIPAQKDQAAATKLAGLLVRQGIEVQRADQDFKACGISYGEGSYVINLAQPAKRFIRTLMDKNITMTKDFISEQERRRAKDLPHEIYDVTAWSLPLMYNITNNSCNKAVKQDFPLATTALYTPGEDSESGR